MSGTRARARSLYGSLKAAASASEAGRVSSAAARKPRRDPRGGRRPSLPG
jgi:hypothetical protein